MKQRKYHRARSDCLSRELYDEVVVYDPRRDVGHCLNSTAAAVWKLCDGETSPSEIASALSQQLSSRVSESVVHLALQQLVAAHLLVEPELSVELPSRRLAIHKIGVAAAIALPLITSVVAPTPAHAVSCLPGGAPCSSGSQCCSGICLTGSCFLGGTKSQRSRKPSSQDATSSRLK